MAKSTICKNENKVVSSLSSAKTNQHSSKRAKKCGVLIALAITLRSSPPVERRYWVVPTRYYSKTILSLINGMYKITACCFLAQLPIHTAMNEPVCKWVAWFVYRSVQIGTVWKISCSRG